MPTGSRFDGLVAIENSGNHQGDRLVTWRSLNEALAIAAATVNQPLSAA